MSRVCLFLHELFGKLHRNDRRDICLCRTQPCAAARIVALEAARHRLPAMRRCLQTAFVLCLLTGSASAVGATPILLNFEGLKNLQQVGNFYNGGAGGNYGVTFSPTATALIDQDAGGTGNFAKEPSPSTIMYFGQPNLSASMSVAGGFTSISFWYTSLWFPASVAVLGGATGTTVLASQTLLGLPSGCGGDPTGTFSCWKQITLNFSGAAQSIAWTGVGNFLGVDNILINSTIDRSAPAVPEPTSFVLFGTGAMMAAALLRRLRKTMLGT